MSFSEMMQEAINIRTSTDSKLRVDFDARPKFQQASMFVTEEARAARSLPLNERLAECTAMKLKGNEEIRRNRADEAIQLYEQSLAMLWYLDNRNPNWKTSGIKDEDIEEVNFCPNSGPEALKEQTRDLKVALLLNIARAYSSRSDYATSVQACSAALAINPSSAKGLYLRGKALIAPASAGAFEMEEAMRDISRAAELAPGDTLIRVFLNRLRTEKAKQKETDRATFAGMFSRGRVCDTEASSETRDPRAPPHGDGNLEKGVHRRKEKDGSDDRSGGNSGAKAATIYKRGSDRAGCKSNVGASTDPLAFRRHVKERLVFLNGMARDCEEEGREEAADGYRQRAARIEKVLSEHDSERKNPASWPGGTRPKMDWKNPSEAMRKKAAQDEFDLSNPAVISFLARMQEKHEMMLDTDQGKGQDVAAADDDCDQENWTEEIWEGAILCMTRNEVTTLLKEDLGIAPVPAGATLGELRSLAVRKLLKEQSPNASTKGVSPGQRTPSADEEGPKLQTASWKVSAAITLVLFIFKSFQMGLWRWLATGEGLGANAAVGPSRPSPPQHNSDTGIGDVGRGKRTPTRGGGSREDRGERPSSTEVKSSSVWEGSGSSLAAQTLNSAVRTDLTDQCYDAVGGTCEAVEQ